MIAQMPPRPPGQEGLPVEVGIGQLGEALREGRAAAARDQQPLGQVEIVETHRVHPYLTIVVLRTVPRPSMVTSTVCPS